MGLSNNVARFALALFLAGSTITLGAPRAFAYHDENEGTCYQDGEPFNCEDVDGNHEYRYLSNADDPLTNKIIVYVIYYEDEVRSYDDALPEYPRFTVSAQRNEHYVEVSGLAYTNKTEKYDERLDASYTNEKDGKQIFVSGTSANTFLIDLPHNQHHIEAFDKYFGEDVYKGGAQAVRYTDSNTGRHIAVEKRDVTDRGLFYPNDGTSHRNNRSRAYVNDPSGLYVMVAPVDETTHTAPDGSTESSEHSRVVVQRNQDWAVKAGQLRESENPAATPTTWQRDTRYASAEYGANAVDLEYLDERETEDGANTYRYREASANAQLANGKALSAEVRPGLPRASIADEDMTLLVLGPSEHPSKRADVYAPLVAELPFSGLPQTAWDQMMTVPGAGFIEGGGNAVRNFTPIGGGPAGPSVLDNLIQP